MCNISVDIRWNERAVPFVQECARYWPWNVEKVQKTLEKLVAELNSLFNQVKVFKSFFFQERPSQEGVIKTLNKLTKSDFFPEPDKKQKVYSVTLFWVVVWNTLYFHLFMPLKITQIEQSDKEI